jgi:ribosomal protein S18 acetylase RimI-like enzyme
VAYVEDQAVGWTRVGPRSDFPRVTASRALARVLTDEPGVWWVTCFAVDNHYRRAGVASALLKAAVEFSREHGATAVEGHPVDVAG